MTYSSHDVCTQIGDHVFARLKQTHEPAIIEPAIIEPAIIEPVVTISLSPHQPSSSVFSLGGGAFPALQTQTILIPKRQIPSVGWSY